MGRVLPREKLCVESVPCNRLTRETGSVSSFDLRETSALLWLAYPVLSEVPAMLAATASLEDFRRLGVLRDRSMA